MTEPTKICAVCKAHEERAGGLSRVVIEGRALSLCPAHASTVVAAKPRSFDDLRRLFMGAVVDPDAMMRLDFIAERRSPVPRRAAEDRRAFPPRPEGRRRHGGRRIGDPREA